MFDVHGLRGNNTVSQLVTRRTLFVRLVAIYLFIFYILNIYCKYICLALSTVHSLATSLSLSLSLSLSRIMEFCSESGFAYILVLYIVNSYANYIIYKREMIKQKKKKKKKKKK